MGKPAPTKERIGMLDALRQCCKSDIRIAGSRYQEFQIISLAGVIGREDAPRVAGVLVGRHPIAIYMRPRVAIRQSPSP